MMRGAAQRAQELGFALVPPAKGDGKYLRLILEAREGNSVTLYLDGRRVTAGAKGLRGFASSLPGAVMTTRDVQFPLGTVELSTLEAFARWAGVAKSRDASQGPLSAGASAEKPPPGAAPRAKPRPPWERAASAAPAATPGAAATAPIAPASPGLGGAPSAPFAVPAVVALTAGASGLRSPQVLLVAVVALVLLVGVFLAGFDAVLILGGLAVLMVGVVAVIRGRVRWARIASRGVGAAVVAGGLALLVAGGLLVPTQPATRDKSAAPADTREEAAESEQADLDIAAAEKALVIAETEEKAVTPDALVKHPESRILADDAALAAVESAAPASALAALAAIEVKGRAPKTDYDRDRFGAAWSDVDRNGCDTRNDILKRDLTEESFKPGTRNCVVLTGTLADPYSPKTIAFQRGQTTVDDVQIDHVVALSDAWQKGAQQLPEERRRAFAKIGRAHV